MDYSSTILKYRYFLPKTLTYFYHRRFSFHVSFLCFNSLKIKRFKIWNIVLQCFIFGFNVSFFIYHTPFQKHTRRKIKTQWERFKTSVGEKSNPNGRNTTETLKSRMKHWTPMFHLLKLLIINALCCKNETWNKKTSQGKYYVRARKERNLPRVTYPLQCAMRPRVGIANLGPDVPSWQYLMYWYSCIC